MQRTRCIAATLSEDAWQITDAEGQQTGRVSGTEHEATELAREQLAAYGGGEVINQTR